ncbi:MAG: hypothetical protein HRU09_17675 [Oligoflexales bacterium]|nr:hypothetical protein [Oligoflexales bacterium]
MCRLFLMSLVLCCVSCMSGIPIIGIDEEGVKNIKITKSKYSKKMGEVLADVHDAAIVPANRLALEGHLDHWELRWFNVGVGIEGKVGIIGMVSLAARPRIRLYFRRKYNRES